MNASDSVEFFDTQFQQQVRDRDFRLNPFELAALPYLHGHVLDYGCGLGNLAFAAAHCGCSVLALDASPAAITHIRQRAATEGLPVQAALAERRDYELDEDFDVVVSIGLLMFFDRPTAFKALSNPQAHIRQGGIAVGNVPFDGTTYLYMFDADSYRLFRRTELESRFSGWRILYSEFSDFDAADGQRKAFATITAPRPLAVPEP